MPAGVLFNDLNSNLLAETIDQNNVGSTTDTITNTYDANNELTDAVDAGAVQDLQVIVAPVRNWIGEAEAPIGGE